MGKNLSKEKSEKEGIDYPANTNGNGFANYGNYKEVYKRKQSIDYRQSEETNKENKDYKENIEIINAINATNNGKTNNEFIVTKNILKVPKLETNDNDVTDKKLSPIINVERLQTRRRSIRYASSDSFDRFTDEFCEVVLSYLHIEDKFRYECVSKQWQRTIYRKQTVLRISYKGRHDTLKQLLIHDKPHAIVHNKTVDSVVNHKALNVVLKKCPNLREIQTSDWCPTNTTTLLIANNCKKLESLSLFCHISVSRKTLLKFGENCGQNLKKIRFADVNKFTSDEKTKIEKLLSFCPNIEALLNPEITLQVATKQHFAQLKRVEFTVKSHLDLVKLILLADKYSGQITKVKAQIYIAKSFRHYDKTMQQLARFKNLKSIHLLVYYYDLITITIDDGLRTLSESCAKLRKLDFKIDANFTCNSNIMHLFGLFAALEKLTIQIDLNSVEMGSVRSLRHVKQLKHLTIAYQNLNDSQLKDIDIHLPNLREILLVSQKTITDKTFESLANIASLQKIKIRGSDEFNEFITDTGVRRVIENCPKLRTVFFKCRPNITRFTLDAIVEKARQNADQHFKFNYGYFSGNDYKQIYSEQQLPANLAFTLYRTSVSKWKYLHPKTGAPTTSTPKKLSFADDTTPIATPKKLSFVDVEPDRESRDANRSSTI